MVDLRGDITQFATSAQVLDLILAERTVETDVNQVRTFRGLRPISLGYLLPDDRLARASSGLADVGRLGAQNFLHGLDDRQRALLMKIARPNSIPIHPVTDESPEVGDVTLLPVERVGSAPGALTPLVAQVHERLEKLLRRGMPGVDDTYVTRLLTFFEETAANVRDHAGDGAWPLEGYIVGNRTFRRYRDHRRAQWVEVYTTYLACYDFGRGILLALSSTPQQARELAKHPAATRSEAALRLAIRPGVTSIVGAEGRGGGLPRLVELVRSLAGAQDDRNTQIRGGLRLVSSGACLDLLGAADAFCEDRILPGTQLQLRFDTITRLSL